MATVLSLLGSITVLLPLYRALRPEGPIAVLDTADEKRLRDLLDRQGARDSLA